MIASGRRRAAAFAAAVPDVIERVAGGLRAGATPLAALTDAAGGADVPGDLAAELVRTLEQAEEHGLERALDLWAERHPLPPVRAAGRAGPGGAPIRAAAAALQVAAVAGGPAAAALDGLAAGLRDRHDVAGEVAALSAQARLSAFVVGAAPLVALTFSLMVDRRVAPALVTVPAGRACLFVGLAAETLAGLWMRRIIRGGP